MVAVEAVCAKGKVLQPLAPGCELVRVPRQLLCSHKRRFYRAAIPEILGIYRPNCHHGCVVNEYVSIHNRVCGAVPAPTPAGLLHLARVAGSIARRLGRTHTVSLDELPLHFSGPKRTRYLQAVDDLRKFPVTPRDAMIKAFVKAEKTDFSAKVNPDPRMIQSRSPRYNCALAQYLKPAEKRLYTYTRPENPDSPVIGKCLNQVERAKLLKSKMSKFRHPVVVSLDCKRFDQHVDLAQLKIEHSVWKRMNRDKNFASLLRMQEKNKCLTANRIRYLVTGKRMSGDLNTAGGNCLLMLLMVEACMRELRIVHWDMLDDGDDCLVLMEKRQLRWFVNQCERVFLTYGHEIKVENVAEVLEDVEWCQSKPVEYAPGCHKFVRKPLKVLSTSLTGNKHWMFNTKHAYMNTIGQCELVLNLGVPILQEFAVAIIRNSNTTSVVDLDANDSLRYLVGKELHTLGGDIGKIRAAPVEDCARLSFERAYGFTVTEQLALEHRLRGWQFQIDDTIHFGQEWTQGQEWLSAMIPAYEVTLARGDGVCHL